MILRARIPCRHASERAVGIRQQHSDAYHVLWYVPALSCTALSTHAISRYRTVPADSAATAAACGGLSRPVTRAIASYTAAVAKKRIKAREHAGKFVEPQSVEEERA